MNKPSEPFNEEFLSALLDGELSADEAAQVEQWIAEDPERQQVYREFKALRVSLRALPQYKVSEEFHQRVLDTLELRRQADSDVSEFEGDGGSDVTNPATNVETAVKSRAPSDRGFQRGFVWAGLAIATAVMLMLFRPPRMGTELSQNATDFVREESRDVEAFVEAASSEDDDTLRETQSGPAEPPATAEKNARDAFAGEFKRESELFVDQEATLAAESLESRSEQLGRSVASSADAPRLAAPASPSRGRSDAERIETVEQDSFDRATGSLDFQAKGQALSDRVEAEPHVALFSAAQANADAVIEVRLSDQALGDGVFDRSLTRNRFRVLDERTTRGAQPVARAAELAMEYLLVEGSRSQIEALIADIRQNNRMAMTLVKDSAQSVSRQNSADYLFYGRHNALRKKADLKIELSREAPADFDTADSNAPAAPAPTTAANRVAVSQGVAPSKTSESSQGVARRLYLRRQQANNLAESQDAEEELAEGVDGLEVVPATGLPADAADATRILFILKPTQIEQPPE